MARESWPWRHIPRESAPTSTRTASSDPCASNAAPHASLRVLQAAQPPLVPLATSNKHTSTDCVSSTALMVFRGVGAGVAWTIGVDLYALVGASDAAWREHLASRPATATKRREMARLLFKACGRNVLLFGGFLTVFGGISCSMEMVRGRHDVVNPFVGGFASGLVIMPKEMYKTPKVLVGGAALCGAAAMALYQFIPASSEGVEGRVGQRRERI